MSSVCPRELTSFHPDQQIARRAGARALLAIAVPLALLGACVTADDDGDPAGGPNAQGQSQGGICLPNTCSTDIECAGCGDGRTSCLVAEARCVGCDPNTGAGCPEGMYCSSWGICAYDGQICEVDENGQPTFTCTQNSDCLPCSPMQQVCGPDGKCTACTEANTSHCSQADICVNGQCVTKCPDACSQDSECQNCGVAGNEAHACYQGQCAQCSDTTPCQNGMVCEQGACTPHCGLIGSQPGTCEGDQDCGFCGDGTEAWACKKYPNATQGTCVPAATGCSDFGDGFAMLPPPYDQVTQTCSDDAGCAGISVDYNVGELVRNILGTDAINLGFAQVEIQDAYASYGMHECAAVELIGEASCGICVPCKQDADCDPIGIDPLLGQMFSGDPLAALASSLLLDLLFGLSYPHELHFFCQPVAAGYGACVPCANPLQRCF